MITSRKPVPTHRNVSRTKPSRARLLALLAFAVAMTGLSGLSAPDANALPLALAKSADVEHVTVMVRDGCGRGMRFSNRRQTCVEAFDDRREFRDEPRRFVRDECGRGQRFSNSRQRCVWIDERRKVDDGEVAAGVALGVLGAIIGSSGNNNGNRHNNRNNNQNHNNQNNGGRHRN